MSLIQDIRYAVRLLLKDRWFTFIAAIVSIVLLLTIAAR